MKPSRAFASLVVYALILAGCRGGAPEGAGGAPPGGGMPAMPVDVLILTPKPVDRSSEYVATVKSRRSTTIQPQVDGFVTRINVRPGQRVGTGAVLMQIDAGRQQAAVASVEAMRAARQADLQFARQQAERAKKLLAGGAISQEEYDRAITNLQTLEAQVRTLDAQIREQRVALGYHNVTALTSGVVGDIPVRVGDRVTPQTVLTTIDEAAGLELYINVPVQQATGLKNDLLVHLLDQNGQQVAASRVNFVAPSVDPATQSVLAKAPLAANLPFRPDQVVRVRVVWASDPTLTVPLIAVSRVNAQHFVFVAEKGQGGATVAKQRAVQLGSLVGNDYIVLGGLKAGDQLIVSSTQMLGDGAPVQVKPAAPQAPAPSGTR
jgi:RND family efflux transporter MFP subunit